MSLKIQFDKAIQAHGAWKAKFRDYLNGRAALDLSSVGLADSCEFGQWLNTNGRALLITQDFEEIARLHSQFHSVASEVVAKIKKKDFAGARQDISPEGVFNHASHALVSCLLKSSLHSQNGNHAEAQQE
jgi:hypothetical protein